MSIVSTWFGQAFTQLHPKLQKLHTNGGVLTGDVKVLYGIGIAGVIGKRLGKKLGLPAQSENFSLMVTIAHDERSLHRNRAFGDLHEMVSMFTPTGTYPNGRWIEDTGMITIEMEVAIKEGGWYWKPVAYRVWGLPLPSFLFPTSTAYKKIVDGRYHFFVGFSFPIIGLLLSYSGDLEQQ